MWHRSSLKTCTWIGDLERSGLNHACLIMMSVAIMGTGIMSQVSIHSIYLLYSYSFFVIGLKPMNEFEKNRNYNMNRTWIRFPICNYIQLIDCRLSNFISLLKCRLLEDF